MNYGLNDFFYRKIFVPDEEYVMLTVKNGTKESVLTYIPYSFDMLMSDEEVVDIVYSVYDYVKAPVKFNQEVGKVYIYVNEKLIKVIPILAKETVLEQDFLWCLKYVIKMFLTFD